MTINRRATGALAFIRGLFCGLAVSAQVTPTTPFSALSGNTLEVRVGIEIDQIVSVGQKSEIYDAVVIIHYSRAMD